MRVVLDTNILVSALLKHQSIPGQILNNLLLGEFTLLVDHRILEEYREVLRRPKLKIDEVLVDEVMAYIDRFGEFIVAAPLSLKVKDRDDLPFMEVALSGKADVLVTGNIKDYAKVPDDLKVVTPNQFLRKI